jgi:hypothetical protein
MSEHQTYELLALDRPLTAKQMSELRAISTRAEISPTRFWNEYHWGDLKADPAQLVARYFDAGLHVASWGTRRLMLCIPKERIGTRSLEPYFAGRRRAARLTKAREHVVLDLTSETEEYAYDDESGHALGAVTALRAELMRGDLRPAYLAWLVTVQSEDIDEDAAEPPVPAGLASPTAAQTAMIELLRIDVDLVAAAASSSAASTHDKAAFRRWVVGLSTDAKDAWGGRAASDPELALGAELLPHVEVEDSFQDPRVGDRVRRL